MVLFMKIWSMCCNAKTDGAVYLQTVMNGGDHIFLDIQGWKDSILILTVLNRYYKFVNPSLDLHPAYSNRDIPEFERIDFSRFRLSSYCLSHLK